LSSTVHIKAPHIFGTKRRKTANTLQVKIQIGAQKKVHVIA
jgi:hypothetical protein